MKNWVSTCKAHSISAQQIVGIIIKSQLIYVQPGFQPSIPDSQSYILFSIPWWTQKEVRRSRGTEVGMHKVYPEHEGAQFNWIIWTKRWFDKARKAWLWRQCNSQADRWSLETPTLLLGGCVILDELPSLSWSVSCLSKDRESTFLISSSIKWNNICKA